MAKYEGFNYESGPALSDFLLWEGNPVHTREEIGIETAEALTPGTILEETDGTWAVASAGTGKLGMLMNRLFGRDGVQPAVVVVRDACFSKERLQVEDGIKEAAIATLEKQNIKVAS